MKLRAYLDSLPHGGVAVFAKKLGFDSPAMLYQIAKGLRPCNPALAVKIEHESDFQVTRPELRPDDWRDIWPELAEKVA